MQQHHPTGTEPSNEDRQRRERLIRLTGTAELAATLKARRARLNDTGAPDGPIVAGWRPLNAYMDGSPAFQQELVRQAEEEWMLGQERDALQATRPEGCWCLGLGRRAGAAYLESRDGEPHGLDREFCGCPDGQTAMAGVLAARADRQAAESARRLARHWQLCGVPAGFQGFRLETSPLQTTMPDVVRLMRAMAEPERWWFLWGEYGHGKTGLAVGYAWEFLNRTGGSILFRTMPDLLTELRSSYQRETAKAEGEPRLTEADLIHRYVNAGLFVLDDLGAEQMRDTGENTWVADRLYQIVGRRHAEGRPMVITSNLTLRQLMERVGERIVWRIVEACGGEAHIVQVAGKNQRDRKG